MTYKHRLIIEELRKNMVDITSEMVDVQIQIMEQMMAICMNEFEEFINKNKHDVEQYIDGKILPF